MQKTDDLKHLQRMLAQRLAQGEALARWRLVEADMAADEEADRAHHHPEQEGQAPGPADDVGHGQGVDDGGPHGRAQQDSRHRAEGRPGAGQAALARRRPFGEEDHRAGIFPAHGEPLQDPAEQHQHRGHDADLVIGGQQADGEGGDRHGHHGPEQRMGPADAIADIAEEDGTQGAHEEADGESPEGRHQGERGIVRRKIELADGAGEIAVNGEVVPLHHIAGDAGRDDAAMGPPRVLARHDSVIVVPPVRPGAG